MRKKLTVQFWDVWILITYAVTRADTLLTFLCLCQSSMADLTPTVRTLFLPKVKPPGADMTNYRQMEGYISSPPDITLIPRDKNTELGFCPSSLD